MAEPDQESERRRRQAKASRSAEERAAESRDREQARAGRRKPGADRRGINRAAEDKRTKAPSPPRREQLRAALAALKEGAGETRKQLRGRPGEASGPADNAAARARTILGGLFAGLATLAGWVAGFARGPLLRALKGARRGLAAVAVVLTPARGLLIAAVGCAVLLGLSQFVDYRGVAVGGAEFTGDFGTVAPPPLVDRLEAGDPHSYAFVPVAVIAIAMLALAFARRRWQLTRVVALAGVAAVVVSLLVDRPQGLDEGATSQIYAGVEAQLLGGYWAQLFAGVGLAATSILLGQELRRPTGSREPETAPGPARPDQPRRPRRSREPAGPEGSGGRLAGGGEA